MICKCGSDKVQAIANTQGKIKRRGLLKTLFHIALVCMTGGLWIIYLLISSGSKGKIKTTAEFYCLSCGARVK